MTAGGAASPRRLRPAEGLFADLAMRLADRRCPRCDARQPLYARYGAHHPAIRKTYHVLPCPDCGVPISLSRGGFSLAGLVAVIVAGLVLLGAVSVVFGRFDASGPWAMILLVPCVAAIVWVLVTLDGLIAARVRPVVVEDGREQHVDG